MEVFIIMSIPGGLIKEIRIKCVFSYGKLLILLNLKINMGRLIFAGEINLMKFMELKTIKKINNDNFIRINYF
jgi:hypothetical protein